MCVCVCVCVCVGGWGGGERLDPDEMTHYEPTHQDLHRWKKIWSAELKGLNLYV